MTTNVRGSFLVRNKGTRAQVRAGRKRAFRKVRSRLKKRMRSGADLDGSILSKYHLGKYRGARVIPPTKLELVNQMLDLEIPVTKVSVPETFCFLRAPDETSKFLYELNNKMNDPAVRNINVIHEGTYEIGLSASWLFDECIKAVRDRWAEKNKKLFLRGTTSVVRQVNNFLMAFGFLKEMKVDRRWLRMACDPDYETKFRHFRMSGSKKITHKKGNACTELVAYFDTCLGYFHQGLTPVGRGKLVDAFGEIIGNAEEHGGAEIEWHVLGCFEKGTNYCNFAIINKGLSIYETLSDKNSTTKTVLEKIEKVVLDHRNILQKAGDFLFKDEKWPQTIWNVMALQEGISSKRTEDAEGNTRGQGMMDILEFIAEIRASSEDAQVAVVSGHSYMLIDYEYPIRRVLVGQNQEIRRQISFNKDGDLHQPQDTNKVRYLEHPFAGTIITGRFKLSANYVIEKRPMEKRIE